MCPFLRLALGPIVTEIMKNKLVSPASERTRTLTSFFELVYIFHRSWINLSIQWKEKRMTTGFCRGQIFLMENATIPDQKNVSTDSGLTFLHPCYYSYQHYKYYGTLSMMGFLHDGLRNSLGGAASLLGPRFYPSYFNENSTFLLYYEKQLLTKGRVKKKRQIIHILCTNQGLFCHDQMSLGEFLDFFFKFVTQFTHVSRHHRAQNRKQKVQVQNKLF